MTGPAHDEPEPWERTLPCQDVAKRSRELRVYITEDAAIGLHAPAGEVAQLSTSAAAYLRDVLTAAIIEATHRGAEWG